MMKLPELTRDEFAVFFEALHGHKPFRWQTRLAAQACDGAWPRHIKLPTSSGKTSCIDIAIFALAHQASRRDRNGTPIDAARRIFFVVDRRIIVNEAYRRTCDIRDKLCEAVSDRDEGNPLYRVALWLVSLAGNEKAPPLDCFELRGGIYRDDAWVRSLLQPTVLTSTVDQVGSRLLFRGYGVSDRNLPIHAALTANDALILLDEAHCSKPFSQTMAAIARYRDTQLADGAPPRWAQERINTPFRFIEMTATPRAISKDDVFELNDADYAADPQLEQRHGCAKSVRLVSSNASGVNQNQQLAKHLTERAIELAKRSDTEPACHRIAIVVNRVACARGAYCILRKKFGERVQLMIGRMRPIDQDRLASQLQDVFRSGSDRELTETQFVVATQCLEVGADFDFDGMVCQCASLDALRQRFGRLNRLGRTAHARGVVVMPTGDLKPKKPDPIYAESLPATWEWLMRHAQGEFIDFGIRPMDRLLDREHASSPSAIARLAAPAPDAPVLMPAHLDMLCQTGPRPALEPNIAAFLHGPHRGIPEVRVCWRADLPQPPSRVADLDVWAKTCEQVIVPCPPSSAECLSVLLPQLRRWLQGMEQPDETGDVIGQEYDEEESSVGSGSRKSNPAETSTYRCCVVWSGQGCRVASGHRKQSLDSIPPNGTVVLPTSTGGWDYFGHIPNAPDDPSSRQTGQAREEEAGDQFADPGSIDVASEAFFQSRARYILRVHPAFATSTAGRRAFEPLLDFVNDENMTRWHDALLPSGDSKPSEGTDELHGRRAEFVITTRKKLHSASAKRVKMIRYPGGFAVIGPRVPQRKQLPRESFDDEHDEHNLDADQRLSLADHLADVSAETERLVSAVDLPSPLRSAMVAAAERHDLGKADPRFQAMLLGASLDIAWMQPRLWAKSAHGVVSAPRWEQNAAPASQGDRLPAGFRHEMLSLELAQRLRDDLDFDSRDVMLHVIAAHHGHARPFAPVVIDDNPPAVGLEMLVSRTGTGPELQIDAENRLRLIPAHQLNSGISERFWQLTRRFGWWGLAWLESTVRLADWVASAQPQFARPRILAAQESTSRNDGLAEVLSLSCPGLSGASPLGFLSAVGLFRHVATALDPDARMLWKIENGTWCPTLLSYNSALDNEQSFVNWLMMSLDVEPNSHGLARVIGIPDDELRLTRPSAYSTAAKQGSAADRAAADWLSCNGSDLCDPTSNSQLQTARRDYFTKSIGAIIGALTRDHLGRTLFRQWDYADPIEKVSLHIEPREDRRHAYQWHMPTGDPTRSLHGGMVGANRLALEAWPLFQSIAVRGNLQTVGFRGTRPLKGIHWTWPLWTTPVGLCSLTSLLNLRELQLSSRSIDGTTGELFKARGISVAFRLRRILVEKTPNFTPPVALFTGMLNSTESKVALELLPPVQPTNGGK